MRDASTPARARDGCSGSDLVQLDADHPGFRDPAYRRRREIIAGLALAWGPQDPVPDAPYSAEEHGVWRSISALLRPLHDRWACQEFLAGRDDLQMPVDRIPQLSEINSTITPVTGFRMVPVAGLVMAGHFLSQLHRDVFLSTQYIRHNSRPLYTPEPDVVHELIGHAAGFMDPRYARLSHAFGAAATRSNPSRMVELERLYWFTVEFGVLREAGGIKACGAGLLSSAGELGRFASESRLLPFSIEAMARTPYDPTGYQATLFVAESYSQVLSLVEVLDHW